MVNATCAVTIAINHEGLFAPPSGFSLSVPASLYLYLVWLSVKPTPSKKQRQLNSGGVTSFPANQAGPSLTCIAP